MQLLGYLPLFATHEDLLFLFKIRIKNRFSHFLLLKNRPGLFPSPRSLLHYTTREQQQTTLSNKSAITLKTQCACFLPSDDVELPVCHSLFVLSHRCVVSAIRTHLDAEYISNDEKI